jgi:hypothetical protein
LKTFTALGMPTVNVSAENTMFASRDWPETNMWWPHTRNDSSASEIDEYATKR